MNQIRHLGADIFVLSDAGAVDTIADFSSAEGEVLDIADTLDGYDPLNDAISDFVNMTSNGSDTTISVDVNGANAYRLVSCHKESTEVIKGSSGGSYLAPPNMA